MIVPEDRLLIEPGAPYLAPEPYRGKRNEPTYVRLTIKEVRDKNEYITNGRPEIARIKRDADVAAAEADRDTAIKRAIALENPQSPKRKLITSALRQRQPRQRVKPKPNAIPPICS